MEATSRKPLSSVSFLLIILVLENCEGFEGPDSASPVQSTHERDPVPADYPHQDEQFPGPGPIGAGNLKELHPSQGHTQLKDIRTESAHEIFLSDRVVRSICKSLSTFAQTGVLPKGRAKRLTEDASKSRCGFWKSVASPSGSNDGTCGFQWVGCGDVDSGKLSSGTPVSQDDLGSPMYAAAAAEPKGEPGDESELNLHLPSPAEWQRRFNSTLVNTEDE